MNHSEERPDEYRSEYKKALGLSVEMKLNGRFIRQLTEFEKERWAEGVNYIVTLLPFLRPVLGTLTPMVDITTNTTYVDPNSRVGVCLDFFYTFPLKKRAVFVLHEAMHVMNHHFNRARLLSISNQRMNVSGDLEINTTIQTIENLADTLNEMNILLPERCTPELPKGKLLEYYDSTMLDEVRKQLEVPDNINNGITDANDGSHAGIPREYIEEYIQGQEVNAPGDNTGDGDNSGDISSDSNTSGDNRWEINPTWFADENERQVENGGQVCDTATDSRVNEADSANIGRMSPITIENSINQSVADAQEWVDNNEKGYSKTGSGLIPFAKQFISIAKMKPQVPWRDIFRKIVASINSNYETGYNVTSYLRVNRRYSTRKTVLPGRISYIPTLTLAVDTSGSMGSEDFKKVLVEAYGIMQEISHDTRKLNIFCVDTKAGNIQTVTDVSQIKFTGGGGTDMCVAMDTVNRNNNVPDILVVATDGWFDWNSFVVKARDYKKKVVVLVTSGDENKDHILENAKHVKNLDVIFV